MKIIENKGATLLEVMISTAVFAVVSMTLMAAFNLGLKYWRDVDSKFEAERYLNRAMTDIDAAVRNSDVSRIATGYDPVSGDGIIVCGSAAGFSNDRGILEKELSYSSSGENLSVNWSFNVVYFTFSPENCGKCIPGASRCVHKRLVKRWFSMTPEFLLADAWPADVSGEDFVSSYIGGESSGKVPAKKGYSAKRYDSVLASDLIYFKPSGIEYSIKALKTFGMTSEHFNADEIDKALENGFRHHSIVVSSRFAPLNDFSSSKGRFRLTPASAEWKSGS